MDTNVDWNAGNTCAGYSAKLWNTVTGENIDAANAVGITNPATLSQSIIDANGGTNTNTTNQNNNTPMLARACSSCLLNYL